MADPELPLDAYALHLLSVQHITVKDPEPDFDERMRQLRQECEDRYNVPDDMIKFYFKHGMNPFPR